MRRSYHCSLLLCHALAWCCHGATVLRGHHRSASLHRRPQLALATAQNSTVKRWPRHANVTDNALGFTFRGDDFLPEDMYWVSQPHVCECAWPLPEALGAEPDCDRMAMKFAVVTPTEHVPTQHYGRDYVQPLPDADLIKRLREGPLAKLVQQRNGQGPLRVTFVLHGYIAWMEDGPGEWMGRMARELVQTSGPAAEEDAAITIEWTRGAHASWHDCRGIECIDDYSVAMADTRVIGKYLERLAAGIHEIVGSVNFGCIGHSVGAHACGFFGKYIKEAKVPGLTLSRISGLDPAGPSHSVLADLHSLIGGRSWVDHGYRFARLSGEDAAFVDTYTSDPGGFGYDYSLAATSAGEENVNNVDMLGHVNFLVNGEEYAKARGLQPGCETERVKKGCSHHVAIEAYVDTLKARSQALSTTGPIVGELVASESMCPILTVCIALLIISAICAVVASGQKLPVKFRVSLVVLSVALVLIVLCLVTLRAAPTSQPAQWLRQPLKMMKVEDPADYCGNFEGDPGHVLGKRCVLPFSADVATSSGSTCPTWAVEREITFGICADHAQADGLYMADVPD